MKIGILDCDRIDKSMRGSFKNYAQAMEKMLSPIDEKLTFLRYQVTRNDFPENIDECRAYIVTGSQHSVYDDLPWLPLLENFIREVANNPKIRLVGICFGHQIIAQALGGKVEKSKAGWGLGIKHYAVKNATTIEAPTWMQPFIKQFSLPASHQDQVFELPPKATLLAGAEYCPHAAYLVENSIMGIQGHPEFTREYLEDLIHSRLDRIDPKTVEIAKQSLSGTTNSDVVAQWIYQFLTHAP